MGGAQEGFLTTQWSWIMGMGTSDSQRHKAILDQIVRRYWKPVYCYLRRRGCSNEQAKDLTQAFFCDIVLDTDLIRRADKTKGRFRTFLLTALECYVVDEHRSRSARSRSPKGTLVSLDDDSIPELPAAAAGLDPSAMFSYVWATQILDDALLEVERQCLAGRKETHWKVFRDKGAAAHQGRATGTSSGRPVQAVFHSQRAGGLEHDYHRQALLSAGPGGTPAQGG